VTVGSIIGGPVKVERYIVKDGTSGLTNVLTYAIIIILGNVTLKNKTI
jgi:hypothetical protein